MIFLILSIFSSTIIYLVFKLADKFNANTRLIITINYLIAVTAGIIEKGEIVSFSSILHASWLPMAIVIGILFVVMFFLIGYATQKVGISITSIATRLSMVLPILTSAIFFDVHNSIFKITILTVTVVASILSIYKKPIKQFQVKLFFLPIILFVGSGAVDSLVKIAQELYIPKNEVSIFSSSLFFISLVVSALVSIFKHTKEIKVKSSTYLLGLVLGLANFGSLYFLINALNSNFIESSLIFGVNNVSIVVLSLILGNIFFNERISKLNKAGMVLASICIIILGRFNGAI